MTVRGFNQVVKNLNSEIGKIKGRAFAGLVEAGLKIESAAKKRVPVDKGFLRGSGYTKPDRQSESVEVGFSAAYALFVHENMEQKLKGQPRKDGKGHYWEVGQPKFLESAISENRDRIIQIVKHHARIK